MDDKAVSSGNFSLIVNIIILAIGIVLIAIPNAVLSTVTLILGIVLIGYGGITLATIIGKKTGANILIPVLCLALGVILIIFNNFFANTALPFVIGIWMIIMGIMSLVRAVGHRDVSAWKLSLILSLAALVLGIIILAGIATGSNALGVILGIAMVIYGAVAIINWAIGKNMQ